MTDILNLNHIRSVLVRLEETIIFNLIERAQFKHNQRTYEPGLFETELLGWKGSWLEWILLGTESFQSKARRYESPDEYPFNDYETLPGLLARYRRTKFPIGLRVTVSRRIGTEANAGWLLGSKGPALSVLL